MKNLIYSFFLLLLVAINAKSQTNDFKIGIIAGGQKDKKAGGIDGYETSIYLPNTSYYSSIYGVLKDDGVNLIRLYSPVTENKQQFKDLIKLIGNHNMKVMTSFNDFAYKIDYPSYSTGNIDYSKCKNIFDLGDASTWDNNYGGYFLNYTTAFDEVYNISPYKEIVWGHVMLGEYNINSPFPFTNKNGIVNVRPDRWNCNIGDSRFYGNALIPTTKAAEQIIEFNNYKNKTTGNFQKLLNSPGCHSEHIGNEIYPNGSAAYAQPYLSMSNRGDACYDAGYQACIYNMVCDPDLFSASRYLWKFDNIDFEKQFFNDVYAEFDIAREPSDPQCPECMARIASLTPLNPNFELAWFNAYTSIIHGVKGCVFYSLDQMFAIPNDALRLQYDDATLKKNMQDTSIQNRFAISNFPNDYTRFQRHLFRELSYLKNLNLLSTNPASIVCSKTTIADMNGILPACSSYLPSVINPSNSKGLFNINGWPSFYYGTSATFYGKNDERFGIRYTIRTNGSKVIMILTNPTPFYINLNTDNACLNFGGVANGIIRNSVGVNMLFEGNPLYSNYNTSNSFYKTTRSSNIDLINLTVGTKYYYPFTAEKKLYMKFAPFDVHVIEFVPNSNYQIQGYNNGWDKVWSNNGSGYIEDWQFRTPDQKVAGDFDGDGKEELLMIQNPDISTYSSWVNMYKYANGKWNWNWSNNGIDNINDWGIREFDHFYVGDFVKEISPNLKKTELLIIQKNFDNPAGGGYAGLYRFENGSWQKIWGNSGNGRLGWWGLRNEDKWIIGDFNNDGQDDLLSIQALGPINQWAQLHTFSNGDWQNLFSNDLGGVSTGKIGSWNINNLDHFYAGKFNGEGDKSYLLCFDGDGPFNRMLKFNSITRSWEDTGYSNSSGSLGGINVDLINTLTDKYLVGGTDNTDTKDEFLEIQRGANAYWSVSVDLNSQMTDWNWNWSASPDVGNHPFIDDWSINDNGGYNTDYLLIKAVSTDPKYLMAFRSFGSNNNYLVSMYKSQVNTNKSAQITSKEDKLVDNHGLNIYPNPASNKIVIESNHNEQKTYNITLANIHGQEILSKSIILNNIYSLDITNIENGIYILTLRYDKETIVKKIVVRK